jgi:phosphatidylglycerophosphate synthase
VLGRPNAGGGGVTTAGRPAVAHAVSLLRPALGLFVLFYLSPRVASPVLLAVVAVGAASDWFDGVLARRAGSGTPAGRILDNLCDFAFLICIFVFAAQAEVWSPPVWGRLARYWDMANWLPVPALLASFGVYFFRLCREVARGREPGRSPRGHAAGISNYLLAFVAGIQQVPGVNLGPWLLEPAMLSVVFVNLAAVAENLRLLMFHQPSDGPTMPA